jgi:hypothetical protein
MNASLAMQRLMMAALAEVEGVTGVYDAPPVDAVAPYLTLGPDLMRDWSTKTEVGHEHLVQVRVWDEGAGVARLKPLMGAVEAVLAALEGARDGHVLVSCRLVRALVRAEAGGWSEGLVEFRLRSRVVGG